MQTIRVNASLLCFLGVAGCAAAPPAVVAPPPIPRVEEKPVARAKTNGVELAWDAVGDEHAEPLLLISGLGLQLIDWPDEFVTLLAQRGFRVIRFDNRDVGLSTSFDSTGDPDLLRMFNEQMKKPPSRRKIVPSYTIADMAEDAAGLLDALGIASAHVVGISMGGMIAQQLALTHPEKVRTLTSIMSTTGDPDLKGPSFETSMELLKPFPSEREAFIARTVQLWRTIGSTGYPLDVDSIRRHAARSYDRAFHPGGTRRQLLAIWAAPSRRAALHALKLPALVIHGEADPLIPVEGGRDTAQAIPGCKLVTFAGMGHDLPRALWGKMVDEIAANAARRRGEN